MKKILPLCVALLVAVTTISAKEYKHSLGMVAGLGIGAQYKVEGDLRSEIQLNIKRLMDIGCYRGVRHRIGRSQIRNRRADGHAHEQRRAAYRQKYLAHLVGLTGLLGHVLVPPSN